MEVLVNDLSIDGQFPDVMTFKTSLDRVMKLRTIAKRHGRDIYCQRNLAQARVTSSLTMPQAVSQLDRNTQSAIRTWITTVGPFWEDERLHGSDEWLHVPSDTVVTDTAVGEAAFRSIQGSQHGVVSFDPSAWKYTPIPVVWVREDESRHPVDVHNFWSEEDFEAALRAAPKPLESWHQMAEVAKAKFTRLTFANDCFAPLTRQPFARHVADRILILLDVLHQMKGCFDARGQRTARGHELYRDFFADKGGGDGEPSKCLFSDSSDSEKVDFEKDLTFQHPNKKDTYLFCPWHGKVRSQQPYRLHFHWPMTAKDECFIVYIGPKLTKR